MPVFIYQEDMFARFVAVEGEEWGRQCLEGDQFKGATPQIFLEAWNEAVRQCALEGKTPAELCDTFDINPHFWLGRGENTIYGAGGWSRYVVKPTGEVVMLGSFAAGQPTIDRARAQGFAVSGPRPPEAV